jgi:hypothetical protein
MYSVNAYDTPTPERIHEFANPHPTHHLDPYATAGYEMTYPYSGHPQSLFADLSPPITQNDNYVLEQFGLDHMFEHSSGPSTGCPASNAETDGLIYHYAPHQLLSPAPSSSPPFTVEHTRRQSSRQLASPDQNFHNDSRVQPCHRGNKRVKLSKSCGSALQPQRHKLKFTADDDALLVDLKETHNHTWKQIAAYFPGRTSGTLQVRYCTRLKAKSTMWNDQIVSCVRSIACKLSLQQKFLSGMNVMMKGPMIDAMFEHKGLICVSIGPQAQKCNTGI